MPAVDWMQAGPFGLMVHWLKTTPPFEAGPELDWDEQVDAFPAEKFCAEVAGTGARWLIFTIGQNGGYYCAPNAHMERLLPGRCSQRDLFGEIADRLAERGVRAIAYLPGGMVGAPSELQEAFAWNADPDDKGEFMRRYVEFVRDYALRYGERLAGWWFDGCYDRRRTIDTYGNRRFRQVDWFEACRAGNPNAVVAMNPGCNTFQAVFEEEDYVGGETTFLGVRPGTGLCGDRQQWHSLTPINGEGSAFEAWGYKGPGPIPGNRYSFDELLNYTYDCHVNGGAVTCNVLITREGIMPAETLEQLQAIAERIAAIKAGDVDPPTLWSPLRKEKDECAG